MLTETTFQKVNINGATPTWDLNKSEPRVLDKGSQRQMRV